MKNCQGSELDSQGLLNISIMTQPAKHLQSKCNYKYLEVLNLKNRTLLMLLFYFWLYESWICSYTFLYQLRDRNLVLLVKEWCFYFSPEVKLLRK